MGTFTVKLKDRKEIANGTIAVIFNKPAGFEFVAGQSIDLTLIDPSETDAKGNMRTLSLASAPYDLDLMVATRVRDTAFKRELNRIPLGIPVKIEGPFGFMTLHKATTRPAVFLAGGIGITPFHSMVCQATKTMLSQELILFYSNRRPEDAAFLVDLMELEKQHSNFKLVATMTNLENSQLPWNGEKGYINKEMLTRFVRDSRQPVYYIAGPPALESALREVLQEVGVEEDDINSECFSGY
jgi:ferredoxin-NADP reductase